MRQVKTTVDLEKEDHYEKIIGFYLLGICCSGIPLQSRENIFEDFQRLPETSTGQPGAGLGLAIVAPPCSIA